MGKRKAKSRWGKGKLPTGIRPHGDGYRAWISIDGKKRYSSVYATIQDAAKVRVELEKLKDEGVGIFKTMADAFQLVVDDIELNRKKKETLRHYEDQVKLLYKTWPEGAILRSITHTQVRHYRDRTLRTHAPGTVNHHLSLLKRMFNLAIEQEWLRENPVKGIKMPQLGTRDEIPFSEQEIADIIEQIQVGYIPNGPLPHRHRDAAIVALVAMTGLRAGEAARLTVGDISVEQSIVFPDGKTGRRTLPLLPELAEILMPFLDQDETAVVFNLTRNAISQIFGSWRRRLNLPQRFHAHNIRKTYATALLRRGADIKTIQGLLGHKHLSTTQIYVSGCDDVAREAVSRLQMIRPGGPSSSPEE